MKAVKRLPIVPESFVQLIKKQRSGNVRVIFVTINVYFNHQQPKARFIGNLSTTLIGEKMDVPALILLIKAR